MHIQEVGKKIVACSLSLVMFGWAVPAVSLAETSSTEVFVENGISYTVLTSGNEVSVGAQSAAGTNYAATSGDVNIPAQVIHDGKTYTVTAINDYAFSNGLEGAQITSVTIPEGLSTVGAYAFDGCANLATVSISSTVSSIGMYAFAYCPNMQTLSFADGDTPLTCGQSSFMANGLSGNQLSEILLPKRLQSVADYMFLGQTGVKRIAFAGKSVKRIGNQAFRGCSSAEYVEVPEIPESTGGPGAQSYSLNPSLKTIVFKGDINYTIDNELFAIRKNTSSTATAVYGYDLPDVQTIVYCGKRADTLFSSANCYQMVSFYKSESDAEAGSDCQGQALVRADVKSSQISASMPSSDAKGALLYSDEIKDVFTAPCAVPTLASGTCWKYSNANSSEALPDTGYAYPVASNDLSQGCIVLNATSFKRTGKDVGVVETVYAADGTVLSNSDLNLTYTKDGSQTSQCIEVGKYVVTASSKDQSYVGSVSANFEIVWPSCTWKRADGSAYYAMSQHAVSTAFDSSTKTVILTPKSFANESLALSAFAGACKAPVIMTDDTLASFVSADIDPYHYSAEAASCLRILQPEKVILLGYTSAQREGAQNFVEAAVPDADVKTLTRTSGASSADAVQTVYELSKKSNSSGVVVSYGKTAIVAAASEGVRLSSVAAYAYKATAPIFLTANGTTLSDKALSSITSGEYDRVVVLGTESQVSKSLADQLAAEVKEVVRWGNSADVYDATCDIAQKAVDEGVLSYEKLALVSPQDIANRVLGATTCGANGSALLAASDEANGDAALQTIVKPNVVTIENAFVLGTYSFISAQLEEKAKALYAQGTDNELYSATIAVTNGGFKADGSVVTPTVVVTSKSGKVLVENTDYTLTYQNVVSDKTILAARLKDAGTYTATATGMGSYSGSCSVNFTIDPVKLDNSTPKPAVTSFTVGKCTYSVTSAKTVTLAKVATSASGTLTVPASVKGYKVTAVAKNALKGCKKLKTVKLASASLTSIGAGAFANCSKLKKLTIKSKGIKSVGAKAFAKTNAKLKITVPKGCAAKYRKLFKGKGLSKKAKVK